MSSGKMVFDVVEGDVRDFPAKEFKGVDLLESKDNETEMKDLAMAKMLRCRIRYS